MMALLDSIVATYGGAKAWLVVSTGATEDLLHGRFAVLRRGKKTLAVAASE